MGKKLSKINNPWVIEAITILVGMCMIAIFYFIEQICGSSRDTVWSVRYLQPFTIASMLVGECMKYYYAGEEECRNIWHIHCILAVVLAAIYVIVVNVTGINVLDVLWLAYAIVIFFGVTSWYMMLSGKASSKVNIAVTNMTFVMLFFYLQEVLYMSHPTFPLLLTFVDDELGRIIVFTTLLIILRLPKLKYFTIGLGLNVLWGALYRCDIGLYNESYGLQRKEVITEYTYIQIGMAIVLAIFWGMYLIMKFRMRFDGQYLPKLMQEEKPKRIVIKLSIFVLILFLLDALIIAIVVYFLNKRGGLFG